MLIQLYYIWVNMNKSIHSFLLIWNKCFFGILSFFHILSCLVALLLFLLGFICLKGSNLVGNTLLSWWERSSWKVLAWEHGNQILRQIRLPEQKFIATKDEIPRNVFTFFSCSSTITRNDIQSLILFHHVATTICNHCFLC